MRIVPIVLAAMMAVALSTGPLSAQTTAPSGGLTAVFTDIEKKIIDEYYRLKARVTGDPQTAPASGVPKKSTATMRGIPKEVGKADDDDGASKGRKSKGKSAEAPLGLAKKDELPPGLAKRDKLPPGLKREPLPADLAAKLPAAKPGTERILVGNDLLLVDKKTSVVLDILKGAAQPRS